MDTTFLEALRKELPPTFSRQVAAEALKGIYSAGGCVLSTPWGRGREVCGLGVVLPMSANPSLHGWRDESTRLPAISDWEGVPDAQKHEKPRIAPLGSPEKGICLNRTGKR